MKPEQIIRRLRVINKTIISSGPQKLLLGDRLIEASTMIDRLIADLKKEGKG